LTSRLPFEELDPRCTSLSSVQDLSCWQHRLARSRSSRARTLGKRQSPNNQLLHTDS